MTSSHPPFSQTSDAWQKERQLQDVGATASKQLRSQVPSGAQDEGQGKMRRQGRKGTSGPRPGIKDIWPAIECPRDRTA